MSNDFDVVNGWIEDVFEEVQRLQADCTRYRFALEMIVRCEWLPDAEQAINHTISVARLALGQKEERE